MDDYGENVRYYKKRYMITFYKEINHGEDEQYFTSFDNIVELCKYKKLPITNENLLYLRSNLCKVLKRLPARTTMLDGTWMRVYLDDMLRDDELEENLEKERRDKCMATKRFVQITSTMNIEVYASLEAIKVVNVSNQATNSFNAKSGWAKIRVLVTAGTSWYPSEILNWPAVKTLAGKEIFTIGAQADTIAKADVLEKAVAQEAAIKKGKKDVENEKKRMSRTRKEEAEELSTAKEEE